MNYPGIHALLQAHYENERQRRLHAGEHPQAVHQDAVYRAARVTACCKDLPPGLSDLAALQQALDCLQYIDPDRYEATTCYPEIEKSLEAGLAFERQRRLHAGEDPVTVYADIQQRRERLITALRQCPPGLSSIALADVWAARHGAMRRKQAAA